MTTQSIVAAVHRRWLADIRERKFAENCEWLGITKAEGRKIPNLADRLTINPASNEPKSSF